MKQNYIVIDKEDAKIYLSDIQMNNLNELDQTVKTRRELYGNKPLRGVFIEKGWPEYKKINKALKNRVIVNLYEPSIIIGDEVFVTEPGKCCSSYFKWAKLNGLNKFIAPSSLSGVAAEKVFKVVCKAKHSLAETIILLGIEDEQGVQYIIEDCGVELVNKKVSRSHL